MSLSPHDFRSDRGRLADDATFSWTPEERQSFFAAIARHRRASWRVTVASAVAIVVATFIVGVMTAPLFYALLVLLFDIANLIRPTPNLFAAMVAFLDPILDDSKSAPFGHWLEFLWLAALPGAIWISLALLGLWRLLRICANFAATGNSMRAPDPTRLAEQRFANVIEEMAIAANLPQPRVLVADTEAVAATVLGYDDEHTAILFSTGLLNRLDRAEMQGVAAHLIGSIANGDVVIGMRAALTARFFCLVSRFATVITGGRANIKALGHMAWIAIKPTPESAREVMDDLAEPFREARDESRSKRGNSSQQTWRDYVLLPLAGPVSMTGFFGGVVSSFVLGSLLSFAWRQRKYMADASAVRLTRDPNTLSEALQKIDGAGGGGDIASWAAHMAVALRSSGRSRMLGISPVPMFPAIHRRLRELEKLGAAPVKRPPPRPVGQLFMMALVGVVLGGLVLLVLPLLLFVSIALSMLFLGLPVGILHALLRWIA